MRLLSNTGKQAHVYHSGKYYFISDNGKETLIFRSNAYGEMVDSYEVGGAVGATLAEVLGDFHAYLHFGA